jgi:RecA-family ATPase
MQFPQAQWVIQGLLPVGLTLLVGKPKLGKSILAQNLCLSVVQGALALNKFPSEKISCLMLSLEDPLWQTQERLNQMMNGDDPALLSNAYIQNRWPKMPDGLSLLEEWIGTHPACRLVIIDTLVEFRPRKHLESGIYERDHSEISEIQRFAIDHAIAIIATTHERKAEGIDSLDRINGSSGVPAAVDHTWIFDRPNRQKMEAKLIVGGRMLRDVEYKLTFNDNLCRWQCEGIAKEVDLHPNAQQILDAMKDRVLPMNVTELARATNMPRSSIYRHMTPLQQLNSVRYSQATKRYSLVS